MVSPVVVPSAADDLKLCCNILLSAPPDEECAGEATLFDNEVVVFVAETAALGADALLF